MVQKNSQRYRAVQFQFAHFVRKNFTTYEITVNKVEGGANLYRAATFYLFI